MAGVYIPDPELDEVIVVEDQSPVETVVLQQAVPTVVIEAEPDPDVVPELPAVPQVEAEADNSYVVVIPPPTPMGYVLGVQGPKGDPGEQGPAGPDKPLGYVHHQGTPSATWQITHNLDFQPNLTVVDSAGTVVEGDVEYLDATTVRVSFSGAFSGTAYLS